MPLIKPMNSAAATILEKLFGKYQTSKQVKGEGFRLPLLKQGLTLAALGSNYERIAFYGIEASNAHDHCVINLDGYDSWHSYCWD
ncbi:hypothetical protein [Candidatus Synechococcus spongiarum]|uniref:hypothetical protein n=1 Tax=Candidatus Synechococcus spongiarum TaxID=431041 RepID=UPI00126904C3|nr:hypothetical protein [Candidatus Synechococcus spongiarum]